jgi:hypothetical protein
VGHGSKGWSGGGRAAVAGVADQTAAGDRGDDPGGVRLAHARDTDAIPTPSSPLWRRGRKHNHGGRAAVERGIQRDLALVVEGYANGG